MHTKRMPTLNRRRFLQSAAAAGLAVPLVGSRAWAQSKDPLKIGVTMPLTGSQAGYGNDFVIGMRQALKDLNDAGGIAGRPLELIVLDTQAEPSLGINAMNRLINVDKAPVILTAWSAVVKAQAPTANREKVLLLNTGANAPEIAHLGEFVYTLFPLADVDISALAKYTYDKLGKRKAAVLYINNDTGIDAAKVYKDVFEKTGGQVVAYEAYDPRATEFSGMLLKVRAASPDMVHVHGLLTDVPMVIAQMRQLGLQQRVSSYSAGYNQKLIDQLGPAAEDFIVTSLAPGADDNPNVPQFLERWKKEQNRHPNGLPYIQYQYDSVQTTAQLFKHVLEKKQEPTGETMRAALLAIKEFDSPLTGKTVVDGHRVRKPVFLLSVEKGQFKPLAKLD
ncbi:ABC transporter substrate-binding protein [Bradyrhizobium sp. LHD-71]|uniref:ABC transporter substrate-binding protein n=1 Tax=Bradyrhizobium sp. LHD-71 TaxID=3072141 RepID=UPI00280CFA0F|nr:ABC transporter substrate-binding protein [Bradyrhizobium sp. LHD-71]MDQ8729215.1 ABC transporter substrate-binding protein [Bradyrhizobium sp. LHD-71]